MKKTISFLLSFSILLSLISTHAFAVEDAEAYDASTTNPFTVEQIDSLVSMLRNTEEIKSDIGLDNVDFYNLFLGNPIQSYIYKDNSFIENSIMYPILENGSIILWAIETNNNLQLTTGLTEEVNSYVENEVPFAIVYDADKTYLYSNGAFILLAVSPYKETARSILNPEEIQNEICINTTELSSHWPISYKSVRSSTFHKLNIEFVSQDLSSYGISVSNICWAAVAASIVNYISDTSLSAVDVAKKYYPPANFNEGLRLEDFPEVLELYNINYTAKDTPPSITVIYNNIIAGYPLASNWTTGSNGHMCTINGVQVTNAYYYIMDPLSGFTTAYYNPTSLKHTFVSSYNGSTYTLVGGACHSW